MRSWKMKFEELPERKNETMGLQIFDMMQITYYCFYWRRKIKD